MKTEWPCNLAGRLLAWWNPSGSCFRQGLFHSTRDKKDILLLSVRNQLERKLLPSVPFSPSLCSSKALDPTELESEGLSLSLEEQLSALTLSQVEVSEPSATVCLNGACFKVELFDNTRRSTKVRLLPLCFPERWNDLSCLCWSSSLVHVGRADEGEVRPLSF